MGKRATRTWPRRLLRWGAWLAGGAVGLAVLVVLLLRWINPPITAFMIEARLDAALAGDHNYHRDYEWVDLEQISPHAAIAVIASEDQNFPFHAGFDFESIRKAVQHNAHSRHVRGASTISQQVAKNLFLWSGGGYFRKGLEAGFTLLIEWLWPKERILEVYLNVAEFGKGIYGVEAAAHHFWRQGARRLNRSQAAVLAAVLPNPIRLRADAPSAYVLARRDWILGQMAGLGGTSYLDKIDEAQARAPGEHR